MFRDRRIFRDFSVVCHLRENGFVERVLGDSREISDNDPCFFSVRENETWLWFILFGANRLKHIHSSLDTSCVGDR